MVKLSRLMNRRGNGPERSIISEDQILKQEKRLHAATTLAMQEHRRQLQQQAQQSPSAKTSSKNLPQHQQSSNSKQTRDYEQRDSAPTPQSILSTYQHELTGTSKQQSRIPVKTSVSDLSASAADEDEVDDGPTANKLERTESSQKFEKRLRGKHSKGCKFMSVS
jgi:hypothetical protein